jgi:transposase
MLTIGLDVHQRLFVVCILDVNGKRIKEFCVRGHSSKLTDALAKLKQPFAICYEASCGYGYLYDQLSRIARRVVVAHPGQLRLIFRSKKKSDRVDARKLATLLYLDQVPTVYVPRVNVRDWRALIEFRHRLIDKRTRVKNGLRALLRTHGVEAPRRQGLWTKKGLAWLGELPWPTAPAAIQRDLLLDELAQCTTRIGRVERELNRIARKNPGVHLLRTIPGVGPRTAEAVVAYIDDPKRFGRSKQVGSYFGLVPCQDQSAGVNRLGHITREGPGTVRKLLVEAAWQGQRRSSRIRARFEQFAACDPQRRKIAVVATAHWLVRVMQTMLRTGETWRSEQDDKSECNQACGKRRARKVVA